MATYKVEIVARLGKLHASFYEVGGSKVNPSDTPALDNVEDVIKVVQTEITSRNLNEDGDSVIFRNIAYDDFTKLSREIKMAKY